MNSWRRRAFEKLCRTVRVTPVADQRPWSSPLRSLIPPCGPRRRCLSTARTFGTSGPIREPGELNRLRHALVTSHRITRSKLGARGWLAIIGCAAVLFGYKLIMRQEILRDPARISLQPFHRCRSHSLATCHPGPPLCSDTPQLPTKPPRQLPIKPLGRRANRIAEIAWQSSSEPDKRLHPSCRGADCHDTLLRAAIHGRHSVNLSWAWLGTPDGTCRSGSRHRWRASPSPPEYG
jgi:hypothetical protein